METINFSVPDEVAQAFRTAFAHANQNAVIADLMCEAVTRMQRGQRSAAARILERRKHAPTITREAFRAAREEGRP
ncbi:MAG: hypothetical protein GY862_02135 [Gammaproteobacteria bacterium]|nr:hypothetical protein [Gammaproteobacteria bacterium]